jgi:predicted RNA-binding Zn ribbon-like protein
MPDTHSSDPRDETADQARAEAAPRTQPAAEPYEFDLSGGHIALDFVNTLSSTSGDHLGSYADLVEFGHQSTLLTREDADRLRNAALDEPAGAAGVLNRAKHLRAALREIFDALAAGREPSDSDLNFLNGDLAVSLGHARVLKTPRGYRWGWSGRNLDAMLWPIARAAADLLTSDRDRSLVRECGADDCRWLFLDTSKNRSRQWCSMQSCGNREKARRHYQKIKASRGGATDVQRGQRNRSAARAR